MLENNNCLYFASGSEYLFKIPSQTGDLRIIIYYNLGNDKEVYELMKKAGQLSFGRQEAYYAHRSLMLQQVTFEKGKEYELKIEVNPDVTIPTIDENIPPDLNGFNISLQELPPNTKFAFDGKDDVGKTYEQIKKEFILYDHTEEAKKE